jgi:glycosyltransferase involved in cell wall biosynthesis
MTARISIAMATYNGCRYLNEQLASYTAQKRLPDELVVCDDDSTDDTLQILNEFAKTAPFPVRINRNEIRLGIKGNFSKAMSLCEGDIIVFSDQDDVWVPEKLAKIEGAFNQSPRVGLVMSDAQIVDEKLNSLNYTLWESIRFTPELQAKAQRGAALQVLCQGNFAFGCTMALRADLRQYVLPVPEPGFPHDEWAARLISAFADIVSIADCLVLYRQHPGQKVGATKTSLTNRVSVLAISEPVRTIRRRWHKRAERYRQIQERVQEFFPANKESIEFLQQHVAFFDWRGQLPSPRILRILPCIGALVRGHYHRHAEGLISMGKDILQRDMK